MDKKPSAKSDVVNNDSTSSKKQSHNSPESSPIPESKSKNTNDFTATSLNFDDVKITWNVRQ